MERLREADRLESVGNNAQLRALSRRLSRVRAHERLGRHWIGGFADKKLYVVQTTSEGHPALHADDDRPRRPRARPDVRLRHDCLRRRAVGPALDHDRHLRVPLALARQRLLTATFPYYELKDQERGRRAASSTSATEHEGRGSRRHRPARHAEVDRQRRAAGRGGARRPARRSTRRSRGSPGPFVVEATIPTPVDWRAERRHGRLRRVPSDDGSYVDRMLEALRRTRSSSWR